MKRRVATVLPLVLLCGVLLGAAQSAQAGPADESTNESTPRTAAAATATACARPSRRFVPTRAKLPSLGRTVKVIQVGRTRGGAIGSAPISDAGKRVLAMDPHTKPGSRHGSVLLNGHTWPDGSAIGNAMLRDLHRGDGIVLRDGAGHRACYVVTKRKSYPVRKVPERSAFRTRGPERLVVVACSGKRLGPGNWARRTLWYASPLKPKPAPTPPSSAPNPPSSGGGGLLGGLLGVL